MDNKGYYKILGVSENASQEEIKKSYRKLASQWHPDKFVGKSEKEQKEAEEKFKEIAEAYDVLGDENKRQQYDNGGSFDFNGFDPFDIFRQHFSGGMGGPFEAFFGAQNTGAHPRVKRQGTDVNITVTLTLKEAYQGATKIVDVTKTIPCLDCNGSGSADGRKTTCPQCHGTGVITETRTSGNMFFQSSHPCPSCNGTGEINKNPCKKCGGSGVKKETVKEKVTIPAGVADGMVMTIPERGNSPVGGGNNGHLNVHFSVKEDPYFTRVDQLNIVHYEEVPFIDALLGIEKEFECLDGTKVKIKLPELTKDGQAFFQKGKGMPDVNNPSKRGDYAVVVKYKYPNKLTKKQKKILEDFKNEK